MIFIRNNRECVTLDLSDDTRVCLIQPAEDFLKTEEIQNLKKLSNVFKVPDTNWTLNYFVYTYTNVFRKLHATVLVT